MAMYWPDAKVALDIVDDPLAQHVDDDLPADWNVLYTTLAQLDTPEGMREVFDKLSEMMGVDPPEKTPEWLAANDRLYYSLKGELSNASRAYASRGQTW